VLAVRDHGCPSLSGRKRPAQWGPFAHCLFGWTGRRGLINCFLTRPGISASYSSANAVFADELRRRPRSGCPFLHFQLKMRTYVSASRECHPPSTMGETNRWPLSDEPPKLQCLSEQQESDRRPDVTSSIVAAPLIWLVDPVACGPNSVSEPGSGRGDHCAPSILE
jgi:hypothetical protein